MVSSSIGGERGEPGGQLDVQIRNRVLVMKMGDRLMVGLVEVRQFGGSAEVGATSEGTDGSGVTVRPALVRTTEWDNWARGRLTHEESEFQRGDVQTMSRQIESAAGASPETSGIGIGERGIELLVQICQRR